jgi:hypothetical protein
MTITFRCPQCKGICAFATKYAGRQARCIRCQNHFIIPAKSDEKAEKIEIEYYNDGDAISGFYRAVFVKSWRLFTDPKSITSLIMVTAVVFFKFFLANQNYSIGIYLPVINDVMEIPLPFGKISAAVCWSILFWYYMEIINSVAFAVDEMPETDMGNCFETAENMIKSVYYFTVTFGFVQFPAIVTFFVN